MNLSGFLHDNWLVLVLSILFIIPFISPRYLGLSDTYFDTNLKRNMPSQKYSILRALIYSILSPVQELLVIWGLRGTVSIIVFAVVGVDLYFRKQLSGDAMNLVSIGIVALYLEQLIDKAKKITVWKLFDWESKV